MLFIGVHLLQGLEGNALPNSCDLGLRVHIYLGGGASLAHQRPISIICGIAI